jgi:HlyD family secretion protein
VLIRNVEPGQTVAASLQAPILFTLAEDLTQMELHVDVDEADVGQIRAEQDATFTVDAYPDLTFPARISRVRYGSQTVDGVVTYETILHVKNKDLLLRPGMTATAEITVKAVKDALLIPNAALRFSPPDKVKEATAGGRSFVGRLLPGPRRHRTPSKGSNRVSPGGGQQQVWTVSQGRLRAVPLETGATDGVVTQVTGGGVTPGMILVVDTMGAAG